MRTRAAEGSAISCLAQISFAESVLSALHNCLDLPRLPVQHGRSLRCMTRRNLRRHAVFGILKARNILVRLILGKLLAPVFCVNTAAGEASCPASPAVRKTVGCQDRRTRGLSKPMIWGMIYDVIRCYCSHQDADVIRWPGLPSSADRKHVQLATHQLL